MVIMGLAIVAGIDDPYLACNLPTYINRRDVWVLEEATAFGVLANIFGNNSGIDLIVMGEGIRPCGAWTLIEEMWVRMYDAPVVVYGDHFTVEDVEYDGPIYVLREDCVPADFMEILNCLGLRCP
jgi:hypothetical protein